jgi:rare lipoprotein A
MTSLLARAGLAAAALALAACASHAPRKTATGDAPPARSTPAGPADDVSRPQSQRYRHASDSGPGAPPIDVSKIPEPVPRAEPRSRYGNKASYSVLGRTYHVLPDAHGYVARGTASWYGNKFHGYMTSSLEPYDMYRFSAAHKTLPLPTYARVTNLENGKSVVVRVNDRGPFHENRLIDLSYAAAVRIGIWPKGTGVVEVRAIDPARPDATPAPLPKTVTAEAASARIYLQLGAFGDRANADRVANAARKGGIDQVDVEAADVNGRTVHRVRVGPLADVAAADALTPRIERLGFGAPRVAIER